MDIRMFCFVLLAGLYCTGCVQEKDTEEEVRVTATVATAPDATEMAINEVVAAAYTHISFAEGTEPDYVALRSIFTDDAILQHFRYDTLNTFPVDQFVNGYRNSVANGRLKAFREVELGGATEYFGHIGHRISAYGSYVDGSEEIVEKGVNSFQVMLIDGEWRISSVIWDVEKEGQVIPERYMSE